MRRWMKLAVPAAGALALAAASTPIAPTAWSSRGPTTLPPGGLTVLTYNVEGLPEPLGWRRAPHLAAIGERLRQLRRRGVQPHVVLLQEAFSAPAQAIGRDAGYRWVVEGPSAEARSTARPAPADLDFEAGASWWHGETEGKHYDSGLMILSDYPVLRVRRLAFPAFACAGFDCLANKGAVLVTLAVPGAPTPVDLVDTHLNSRHSSHVPDQRSLHAWRRQAGLLFGFINRWHDPARPLIVAGDFNTGVMPLRWSALQRDMGGWRGVTPYRDALGQVAAGWLRAGHPLPPDVASIFARGSDWLFFASGSEATIRPTGISVTFGPAAGEMLSDHIGYSAAYSFSPPAAAHPASDASRAGPSPVPGRGGAA